MGQVMPHWLTKRASLSPNKVAIETETGESITFKQLEEMSQSYARKLSTIGVKKGDHVGVLSFNELQMIVTIHALTYLNTTAVMLNARLTEAELLYQLNDANVTFVLTGKDIHLNDYENMQSAYKVLSFSDVMCEVETTTDLLEHIQLTDPMTIIYTSGTTGHPKGVVHTYGNHWWSAISSSLNTGLHTDDKWLAMLPIFHVGGLSIFLKSDIYGMSTFLVESFEASRVNRLILERKITIVSVVTVMLHQLLADLEQETYPNTFRYMLLGGGSCPEQLLLEAKSKHIRVIQSYGMTETSSQIVTLAFADALKKIGSSGKPLFPAEVNILHKDADGIGEVCVKGPMVTNGYYKNERATEEYFVDEW